MAHEPSAREAYDRLADAFAAQVATKPHNAYYDRPALLSLLPPVQGKTVLDAGCGPGIYAEHLLEQGAEVVGLDVSGRMLALARQRLGDRARLCQADLGRPLDFLATSCFDVVLSALSLDYVRDWQRLFADFYRVLRAPGYLVFSIGHPFDEYYARHAEGRYFDVEQVEMTFDWPRYGVRERVPYYRRPLGAMVGPLLSAGFRLGQLLEPRPTSEFKRADPHAYAKLMRQPGFLCVLAVKDAVELAVAAEPAEQLFS